MTDESAKQHKIATKEQLMMIEAVPSELDAAISKLEKLSQDFSQDGISTKAKIDSKFKEMEESLAVYRKELVKETVEMVEAKVKLLNEQKKDLTLIKKKVTTCKDFVNEAIDESNVSYFFTLKKRMHERIAEVSREFSGTELTPIEEPTINFSLSNSAATKELSGVGYVSDGSYLQVGYSSKGNHVSASNKWKSYFFVNEVVTFYVSLSPSFFRIRTSPAEEISAEIQCLRDNTVSPTNITINTNGFAKIQCSFAERGRYVFIVKISGHHIHGSPHPFFIHPSSSNQFQAPLRSIVKLTTPKGLALSKKNQIIVTQEDMHNVTLFGKRCRKVLSFGSHGSGEAQFHRPSGVTVDNNDCIYISDTKNNRIQKFDADGNFIKEFCGEKSLCGILNQPMGIQANQEDEIYVVDRGNGRIVILSTDLVYKFSFGSVGKNKGQFGDPWDIAFDSYGLVYITDIKQHTILIFDPKGEYRGQIGVQGTQKSRLSRPSGIYIDEFGRIFVCEFGNHRVSIFHTSSEFIDCFSTGLSMVNPHSIALDQDGFIYISSAEAVHVF